MALITCPECKNSVSDQARTCPQCGYPIKKPEYTSQYVTNRGGVERGRDFLNKLLSEGWEIVNVVHEVETAPYEGDSWDVIEYHLRR
jgi:hypothetical protein